MQCNVVRQRTRHFIHRNERETAETILNCLEGPACYEESYTAFSQQKETINELLHILALVQSVHHDEWLMAEPLRCLAHKGSEAFDVLQDGCVVVLLSGQIVYQVSGVDVFITNLVE